MANLDFINNRVSVRDFADKDIPIEDIKEIISAAGKAPSGTNAQNWHFVVVKNKTVIKKMTDIISKNVLKMASILPEEKAESYRRFSRFSVFIEKAPVVIAVFAGEYGIKFSEELLNNDKTKEMMERMIKANPGKQSIGAAIENLLLAAASMGYGGCWMTSINHSGADLENLLGFKKDGYMLCALIPIGVPAVETKNPPKKSLDEIMTIIE